jgi:hypothetical protein
MAPTPPYLGRGAPEGAGRRIRRVSNLSACRSPSRHPVRIAGDLLRRRERDGPVDCHRSDSRSSSVPVSRSGSAPGSRVRRRRDDGWVVLGVRSPTSDCRPQRAPVASGSRVSRGVEVFRPRLAGVQNPGCPALTFARIAGRARLGVASRTIAFWTLSAEGSGLVACCWHFRERDTLIG